MARAGWPPRYMALRTFALLLIAVIGLSIRFGLDWAATSGSSADALAAKEVQLKAKELQTAPLRGLDKRVEDTRAQVQAFYAKRIPPNYSSIDRRIGELARKAPCGSAGCNTRKALPALT